MIFNDVDLAKHGQRLISRRLLFAEEAYIDKTTGKVFIPLVDDVILDTHSGRMYRMLSNEHTRVNIKRLSRDYRHLPINTWDFLDNIDPVTKQYIPKPIRRRKKEKMILL